MKKEQTPSVFPAVEYEYWAEKASSVGRPGCGRWRLPALSSMAAAKSVPMCTCLRCMKSGVRAAFLEGDVPQAFCPECRAEYRSAASLAHAVWKRRVAEIKEECADECEEDTGPCMDGVFTHTKVCTSCGRSLPEEAFSRARLGRRGVM